MNQDRKIDLSPRLEGIREKKASKIVRFQLSEIKEHFDENIGNIENQFYVAEELVKAKKISEAEMIWRSQVVLIDSAFDFYMHELSKYGMDNMFQGHWNKTEKYYNLQVGMDIVDDIVSDNAEQDWFINFANKMYEKSTFVSYDSVKGQLNLLGLDINVIADKAFYVRDDTVKTIDKLKGAVNAIYYRRNAIAHQSDRRHADAEQQDISKETVVKYIDNMKKIVNAIHEVAMDKKD